MNENTKTTTSRTIPEDIRTMILSVNTKQKFAGLASKYGLRDNQEGNLEIETNLVMLGLEPPADFITNVKKALNVPEEKARAIAEDINVEIFRPIRQSLKKIHGINDNQQLTTNDQRPITPPVPPPSIPPAPIPKPPFVVPKPPPLLPIREDSNRGSSILQDKIGTKPEDETKLNREEILRDIENPVKTEPTTDNRQPTTGNQQQGTDIVQNKLDGMVRMPKSETDLSKGYSADPYREPIN